MNRAEHCFVLPALTGPISGGTSYNRELLAALSGLLDFRVIELSSAELGAALHGSSSLWVDSLYLAALPELKQRARGSVALIAHYLPSFVALGRAATNAELSEEERAALSAADAFLVTSAFMRDALEALAAPTKKTILVLEPGSHARIPASARQSTELGVIVVANVVVGKGIEPWLSALEGVLDDNDRIAVTIVGSLTAEPEYAAGCQRLVRESPRLAERVRFTGPLSPTETLARLAESDLLVSASRMESYGMALAEARRSGVPILARDAGNSRAHVDAAAGGELASSDHELACACLALARAPALARARRALARANAPEPRSWPRAAQDFMAQLARYEK